jgi:hypothetical protein
MRVQKADGDDRRKRVDTGNSKESSHFTRTNDIFRNGNIRTQLALAWLAKDRNSVLALVLHRTDHSNWRVIYRLSYCKSSFTGWAAAYAHH